jgi:hypothetical protein
MKEQEVKFLEKEIREIGHSIDIKRDLTIGVASGVTVVFIFNLIEYLTRFGIVGLGVFIILFIIFLELFIRKEERRINNIKERLKKITK